MCTSGCHRVPELRLININGTVRKYKNLFRGIKNVRNGEGMLKNVDIIEVIVTVQSAV